MKNTDTIKEEIKNLEKTLLRSELINDAFNDSFFESRIDALRELDELDIWLAAINDRHHFVRLVALLKVNDRKLMRNSFLHDKDEDLRIEMLERLDDRDLYKLATKDRSMRIRLKGYNYLKTKWHHALKDGSEYIRVKAKNILKITSLFRSYDHAITDIILDLADSETEYSDTLSCIEKHLITKGEMIC